MDKLDLETILLISIQEMMLKQSHNGIWRVFCLSIVCIVFKISSCEHVELSKGVQHHWLSVSITEVISERQWPLAFSHSESCSSCGCHTKWPPPTCLLRLLTPGYSTGVSPFHYHFCHLWRGKSVSLNEMELPPFTRNRRTSRSHTNTHS